MNEDLKNIETCLPESILAEVASVPTDPQFVSLVNESLDPLQQQAVQQAGSDAYNEVVASHQPYTFTSQVAQMKSNLILLLRRLWRFPFGSGTLRSLSDMWQHYITRLQGSETYGIPSRLDQLTDLPSAPLLVADRKISGAIGAPDGVSLGRLLCDSSMAAMVTEITDDNDAWDSTTAADVNRLLTIFTNLKKLKLKFRTYSGYWAPLFNSEVPFTHAELYELTSTTDGIFTNAPYLTNNPFRDLETVSVSYAATNATILGFTKIPVVDLGKLKTVRVGAYQSLIRGGEVREIYARALTSTTSNYNGHGTYSAGFIGNSMPNLEKVVIGTLTGTGYITCNSADALDAPNLLHMEFGAGTSCSINLDTWSPTLDSSNLQQFLQNFRSFIVLRLANRKTTSALTLTLSANVYNAVTGANSGWASQHTLAELGITDNDLTDLETELGITSATIYATWLDTYTGANGIHWDINKAN